MPKNGRGQVPAVCRGPHLQELSHLPGEVTTRTVALLLGPVRVESRARVVPLYMVEQRLEPDSGGPWSPWTLTQPAATHGMLTDIMGGRHCHAGVEWVVLVGVQ